MIHENILQQEGIVVADASSIIILTKVSAITKYCLFKKVIVSKHIYDELFGKTIFHKYDDITIYKRLINNKLLNIFKIPPDTRKNVDMSGLTYADASIIELYYISKSQGILTDDGKVCKLCQSRGIPYINSPMALFSMAASKFISFEVFMEKLEGVYTIGRYSKYVYDYMNKLIKKQKWDYRKA